MGLGRFWGSSTFFGGQAINPFDQDFQSSKKRNNNATAVRGINYAESKDSAIVAYCAID